MPWTVISHTAFDGEYTELPLGVKEALTTAAGLLELHGPMLGRPHADTLAGSKHANMKELRFAADNGVWRVAFAFDPVRKAIMLVAGDKRGENQTRFYKTLIAKADKRFDEHLEMVKLSTAGTPKGVKLSHAGTQKS